MTKANTVRLIATPGTQDAVAGTEANPKTSDVQAWLDLGWERADKATPADDGKNKKEVD